MKAIFEKVCKKHGYEEVEAEFSEFKDFKVKWSRSFDWIRFYVSDYLKEAPAEVVEDIAEVLMGKIAGENATYSPESVAWFTSPEFVARNQPIFIERHKKHILKDTPTDALEASRQRLVDAGMIQADADIKLFWGNPKSITTARSSVLMKTVIVNHGLMDVEPEFLDFALYVELTIIAHGFNPDNQLPRGTVAYDYPDGLTMAQELAKMGFQI